MKNVNVAGIILLVAGVIAIGFGVFVQETLDMKNGTIILSSIASIFIGLLMLGIAEIIRLLFKISRQLDQK
ncbi:hypothetical protein [Pseudalkalibacillus salsuginis]|uniref:hypothetical protein n=1 Tax=Pseudalkalibacillus salsuginis TaxID=2910972 RepID=UPI001F2A56D3|nr:hypothetical protein [Pseudalkalibacillus salsuginis]MCF6408799.1 hypothetical protein [Pseudalkalibacillus salsuginis]